MKDRGTPPQWFLEREARILEELEPEPIPEEVGRRLQALLRRVSRQRESLPRRSWRQTLSGLFGVDVRPILWRRAVALSTTILLLLAGLTAAVAAQVAAFGERAFWKPFIETRARIVLGAAEVKTKDRPDQWVKNYIGIGDARAAAEIYAGLGRLADQEALRKLPLTNALLTKDTSGRSVISIGGPSVNTVTLRTLEELRATGRRTRFEFLVLPEAAKDVAFLHPPYTRATQPTDINPRTGRQFAGIVERDRTGAVKRVYSVYELDADRNEWHPAGADYGIITYARIGRTDAPRCVLLLQGYDSAGTYACLRVALSQDFALRAKRVDFLEEIVPATDEEVMRHNKPAAER